MRSIVSNCVLALALAAVLSPLHVVAAPPAKTIIIAQSNSPVEVTAYMASYAGVVPSAVEIQRRLG